MSGRSVEFGTKPLSLEDVEAASSNETKILFSEEGRDAVRKGREALERALARAKGPIYGVNTGFGSLKNVVIPAKDLEALQLNLIRSHAVGMGEPLPVPVVRAMMFLRAKTLALGYSGVRPSVVDQLVAMLNRGIVPVVPSEGSVGASGDLAPLAHLALAMIGEGDTWFEGKRIPASQALKAGAIKPLEPAAKEALALLNGTQMMTALGVLNLLRAENALVHADIACAMTLDATMGTPRAFDERVHRLRRHPGQSVSAKNLRSLSAESAIAKSHEDCGRVQDPYSVRCAPQVHGAARDVASYVRGVLEAEINGVTDNPIVFPEEEEFVSAGNFHGQPVSLAMDTLCAAMAGVASISERRTFRLLNSSMSELPAGLVPNAGLNSGLMMTQVTAAALVSQVKTLSHPASIDSIPTWADQEDHVSMGAWAARKAEMVVSALEKVLAIELVCAAQGLEFRKPLRPGIGSAAALDAIRKLVPPLQGDRSLSEDLEKATKAVRGRTIRLEVEKATGRLA